MKRDGEEREKTDLEETLSVKALGVKRERERRVMPGKAGRQTEARSALPRS